jgi:ligand-binding SRPBCC domain-containing protein
MNFHAYFVDEMEEGHFKSFKHEHFFEEENGITNMKNHLCYETPFGVFGKIFDALFLKRHLRNFILHRNDILKRFVREIIIISISLAFPAFFPLLLTQIYFR